MFALIYGRTNCPNCARSKQIAEQLVEQRDDFTFRYVDIHVENISKEDLSQAVGKLVDSVPQIFLDKKYIGTCAEFEAYGKTNLGLDQ
jgi:glutaredoxin 1